MPLRAPVLLPLPAPWCPEGAGPDLVDALDRLEGPPDMPIEVPLADLVVAGDPAEWTWTADAPTGLTASFTDDALWISPDPAWQGTAFLTVTAEDDCGFSDSVELEVWVGVGDPAADCPVRFTYTASGSPSDVWLAGSFNDWQVGDLRLTEVRDGVWETVLYLPPGAYPYKVVEESASFGQQWSCNNDEPLRQCDAGAAYDPVCTPDDGNCNSLKVVPDCTLPTLEVTEVQAVDASEGASDGSMSVTFSFAPGVDGDGLGELAVTLDGDPVEVDWDGAEPLELAFDGLPAGRHVVRAEAADAAGRAAEPVVVPAWLDGRTWDDGVLYFAFVDRFANGDPSNDAPAGAEQPLADWVGGDWRGLIDRLDYLEALGVTAIWLTAPMDNPDGTWGEECGSSFAGYHGYWPVDGQRLEEHFGDEATFRELIDAAHDRGMRVMVDWVANHVHQDHPWVAEHPDWFNEERLCDDDDDGDGVLNWDQIPETCWFDPFLPDLDTTRVDPLLAVVDQGVEMVKAWDLDGLRVDAVKHMPHAVVHNLRARIDREVVHADAGGTFDFHAVGETFSGDRDLVGSYVDDAQLDGQFDFNVYWALLSAVGRGESATWRLEATFDASAAAYGDALMSPFLGNHDVERFIAHAAGEVDSLYGDGLCPDGTWRSDAEPPADEAPYQRLRMAWAWLMAHPGLPLVYYGDEIGLPGYHDPDNRQPMRFPGELSTYERDKPGGRQPLVGLRPGLCRGRPRRLLAAERRTGAGLGPGGRAGPAPGGHQHVGRDGVPVQRAVLCGTHPGHGLSRRAERPRLRGRGRRAVPGASAPQRPGAGRPVVTGRPGGAAGLRCAGRGRVNPPPGPTPGLRLGVAHDSVTPPEPPWSCSSP